MPTYRLDIEYDGSDWCGWQIQPDNPTVQEAIESALGVALRSSTSIIGSGRTDSGVHAHGQVAHFVVPDEVDTFKLLASLNGILPPSIAIRAITRVGDGFHSRFDAISRLYRYQIATRPIAIDSSTRWIVRPSPDISRMNQAAGHLLGRHDFSSFCRTASETKNRICTITRAEWTKAPSGRDGDFDFYVQSDRFLHGMVRAFVGTLIDVGQGITEPDHLAQILTAKDRTAAGSAAPAKGLTLEYVRYPDSPSNL